MMPPALAVLRRCRPAGCVPRRWWSPGAMNPNLAMFGRAAQGQPQPPGQN